MRRLLLLQVLLLAISIIAFSEAKKTIYASIDKGKKNPFQKSKQGNGNGNNGNGNGNNGNGNSNSNNGVNNGNGNGKGNKATATSTALIPILTTTSTVGVIAPVITSANTGVVPNNSATSAGDAVITPVEALASVSPKELVSSAGNVALATGNSLVNEEITTVAASTALPAQTATGIQNATPVKTALFAPEVAISINDYVTYNTPFTITTSSDLKNQPITFMVRCNNSYTLNLLINTSQRTSIDLGTRVSAYDTCDLLTESNEAFDASNTISVQVLPAAITLSAIPEELTAGLADITYVVNTESNPIGVSVSLYCFDQLKASVNTVTSNSQQVFPVPSDYFGACRLVATSSDPNYALPAPVDISILAQLRFTEPAEGAAFNTSSVIPFKLTSSNGLIPTVALTLTCDGRSAGSASGPITGINLNPTSYGNCQASISSLDHYNTSSILPISVSRILFIESPVAEASLGAGSSVVVRVSALYGDSRDLATISGLCTSGSFSLPNIPINQDTTVQLPTGIFGSCRIKAGSEADFYLPSAETVIYASSQLIITKPSITTNWTYQGGDSEILIEASSGSAPDGQVRITCTHAGQQNLDVIVDVTGGSLKGYLMTGYGACKLITLFDEKLYANIEQQFYSKAAVKLQISNTIYYGEAASIQALSDIPEKTEVKVQVTCSDGYQERFTLINNDMESIMLTGATTGASCAFTTEGDEAFTPAPERVFSIYARLSLDCLTEESMLAGEEAQFMMQSSDSKAVPVSLSLTCPNGESVFKMLTSTQPQAVTIPAEISGPCTAKLASEGNQYYLDSANDYLVIKSPITITDPIEQKAFTAGEMISISGKAADGNNPVVTVLLLCKGIESGSVTGLLGSGLVLEPLLTAYGACSLQVSTEEAYYDVSKATVNVAIYRQLSIAAPLEGSSVVGGEEYELMVSSIDKTADASILVRGVCSFGEFTAQVLSNTPITLAMNGTVQGDCQLTAESTAPYYLVPTEAVSMVVMSKVSILAPLPDSNWNYGQFNLGRLAASSGRPFNPTDGQVEVRCSYRGVENFAQNFSVIGDAFGVADMEGYGTCQLKSYFNSTVFVNTEERFYTKASVTLSVTGTARKLIDRLTKRILGRK